MLAHRGRNVLLAAVLATAVAAPAVANDAVTTAQQTAVGQGTAEMAPAQDNPVVVKESFATVTNGPAAAPRVRPKVSSARQPSGDYYRASGPPLILGIRH
jgi:hypothetical protein